MHTVPVTGINLLRLLRGAQIPHPSKLLLTTVSAQRYHARLDRRSFTEAYSQQNSLPILTILGRFWVIKPKITVARFIGLLCHFKFCKDYDHLVSDQQKPFRLHYSACFILSEPSPDFPHQIFITLVPNHARCRRWEKSASAPILVGKSNARTSGGVYLRERVATSPRQNRKLSRF